jgi:hypothetical protein
MKKAKNKEIGNLLPVDLLRKAEWNFAEDR